MPIYEKKCSHCSHEFEVFASMSNYNKANSEPCPSCNETGFVESKLSAVAAIDPMRLGRIIPSSEWTEKLNRIHAVTPGSQLDKTSTLTKVTNQ